MSGEFHCDILFLNELPIHSQYHIFQTRDSCIFKLFEIKVEVYAKEDRKTLIQRKLLLLSTVRTNYCSVRGNASNVDTYLLKTAQTRKIPLYEEL